ncbi:membrane protein [Afipia sp. P52-10]|uniref:hypothetical protein n=1 Tax=Afipia sp. P52-10 TaxID=1429916 RepID=UPI0003DF0B24|nr:hypothetical protein [Afipia sp. P52-10]ETR75074.1 membrane protein [Afipia sp. P52-10]
MDKSIPPFAAHLLDFIGGIEAPKGYETVYGNNQAKLAKPLTQMTIAEVMKAQPTWTKRFGSSAAGRYQFMLATLRGLVKELGLDTGAKFDAAMQDRLGYHLLKRRGYDRFVAGEIGVTTFAKLLAQEWASLPVLQDTKGAHRDIKRGQSYYAGDGLNKSLVPPQRVEALLRDQSKAKQAAGGAAVAGGAVMATTAAHHGLGVGAWIGIAAGVLALLALGYLAWRWWKNRKPSPPEASSDWRVGEAPAALLSSKGVQALASTQIWKSDTTVRVKPARKPAAKRKPRAKTKPKRKAA